MKLKILAKALNFLVDKTADFFVNLLSNSADKLQSGSINFSEVQYEREIRKNLDALQNEVTNLEAVVYQGKRLYERSAEEIMSRITALPSSNITIKGDVKITINLFFTPNQVQTIGETLFLSGQVVQEIISGIANELFEEVETNESTKICEDGKTKLSEIISNGIDRLCELREGE